MWKALESSTLKDMFTLCSNISMFAGFRHPSHQGLRVFRASSSSRCPSHIFGPRSLRYAGVGKVSGNGQDWVWSNQIMLYNSWHYDHCHQMSCLKTMCMSNSEIAPGRHWDDCGVSNLVLFYPPQVWFLVLFHNSWALGQDFELGAEKTQDWDRLFWAPRTVTVIFCLDSNRW